MADPFLAEIRIFPFNFAPRGWAWCDGQLIPLSQNTALFSLLGTTYGGNGKTNFALPDLQGRAPMHPGQGNGLSDHYLGESAGEQAVTLNQQEMPAHNHFARAISPVAANQDDASPNVMLAVVPGANIYAAPGAGTQPLALQIVGPTGSSLPHNNMQPFLTFYFCIAMQGIFPQRP
jgi:microcystin-dependent protein